MKKRQKIIYGILLPTAAALALTGALGVQESQARYVTVAGWHTQVYDPANAVTSSLLVRGGQTVMIGELAPESSYQLPVRFAAEGANVTGALSCEALEHGEYIQVDYPSNLTLIQGTPQNFTLTLTPTALALDPRDETVTVKLRMRWEEDPALEAILQIELLPAGQQTSVSQTSGTARDLSEYVTIMEDYAPGSLLGMTCNIPEDCTSWQLGMLDGNFQDVAFPAGTRYSLDGGESYRMLPKDARIDLAADAGTPVSVWFDFSQVATEKTVFGGMLSISVSGEAAGQWYGKNIFSVNAELELPADSEKGSVAMVTRQRPLELTVPQAWDHTQMEYTLTRQGAESDAPMPTVTVKDGKVLVSATDGQAKPGTYTLVLSWKVGQLEIARRQIVLFVNYSAYAASVNTAQTTITKGGQTQ